MATQSKYRKQPLSPRQLQQRKAQRRETAKAVGAGAVVAGAYAGVGYYYYRSFTTPTQRAFHRAQLKGFARSLKYANTYRIANARFKTHAQRGMGKVSSRVMRPFSPQAKFNRYYNRRTQKQMFGMRVTAARMRMGNARNYRQYSKGRFGTMTNAPHSPVRNRRLRRDYKGRFAGWM